jgi:hypothetical protein
VLRHGSFWWAPNVMRHGSSRCQRAETLPPWQHGLLVGQSLTELLVYNMYSIVPQSPCHAGLDNA